MGGCIGTEVEFYKMRSFGAAQWLRLYGRVNAFNVTELYTSKG